METLEQKQNWTLKQKMFHFFEVLDVFYHKTEGKVYLACSGGKDSEVMRYYADKWCKMMGYPLIPIVFNNTTNEYQEILEFVKEKGDRVTWLRPKITFAQSLLKNGYPLISKEQSQFISEAKNTKSPKLRDIRLNGAKRISKSNAREYVSGKISEKWRYMVYEDIEVTDRCCEVLKKAPVRKYEKETGLSPIIGVMAEESSLRKQQYNKSGCNTFGKRNICKPLSIFTEKDIWDLIELDGIDICSVYFDQIIDGVLVKGEERTGCAYCGFGMQYEEQGQTKFDRLHKREPKRYFSIMDKLGYRKALEKINIHLP